MASTPGFVLAGTHSGVGKTTLTLALLQALKNLNLPIQSCKVGPDFIDPRFHEAVTGTPAYNLDACLLGDDTMVNLYGETRLPGHLTLVEGVMGLFDGRGTRHEGSSTAWVARCLGLPVVLVIDGGGLSTSAAALVKGYRDYDPAVKLAGVIVNRISGEKHYRLIQEAVERDTGIPCLGWMPREASFHLESRHLGLVPAIEVEALRQQIQAMAQAAAAHIELHRLPGVAQYVDTAPSAPSGEPVPPPSPINRFSHGLQHFPAPSHTVGVAYDAAFHFYYQSNLDWLRHQGCRLIPVSPLKDTALPADLDALYLGGGFPEMFGEELEANTSFRESLHRRVAEGLPVYAECGGFQYLCRHLTDLDGRTWQMTGVFQAASRMTGRLQHFGYCRVTSLPGQPYFPPGITTWGHEFHRGVVEELSQTYQSEKTTSINGSGAGSISGEVTAPVLAMEKPTDPGSAAARNTGTGSTAAENTAAENTAAPGWTCGMTVKNTFGGFPHIFFHTNPDFGTAWLKKMK
ncbi:cobyrinate a,c-diamide synthase [Anoxynatronum buryatiense]|uniref:Cobyrinate a,c-diamide synthase n=1 Tax=Anoxynatronum buryatiense TaxID=489973 RepID=A0AA45WVY1_9CLOT|nr:cobyrinate a,c-diamide synthase [Anoxynatronum buryatiense]SMP56277.1 hydrogenobyrinic acid a,c-diamide synthase (glutamine-hydrolysing) /cobyrinate a,c-diamide synthase [Anoxynatronum buryatiense]